MPAYGGNPAKGVGPRACEVCGSTFQPYRDSQTTCELKCYRRLPRVTLANSWRNKTPQARERKNELRRARHWANPHAAKAEQHRLNLLRYGLAVEEFEAMRAAQDGRCAICGDPPRPGTGPATQRLHVDHDHDTGRVRGLLCNNCNRGLGYFKDDVSRLLGAIAYLKEA